MSRNTSHDPVPARRHPAGARRLILAACAAPLLLLGVPSARALPAPVEPPPMRAQLQMAAPAVLGAACLRDASHAVRALCMHRIAARQVHASPAVGRQAPGDDEAS